MLLGGLEREHCSRPPFRWIMGDFFHFWEDRLFSFAWLLFWCFSFFLFLDLVFSLHFNKTRVCLTALTQLPLPTCKTVID